MAVLAILAPHGAEASCNFVPGAENVFRASASSLDRPFGAPGFPVVVQLDLEGCEADAAAGFVDQDGDARADDDFAVVLLFTPPNGPASAVVVHDIDDPEACAGFSGSASQTSCEAELPLLGDAVGSGRSTQAACVTSAIDVVDASTLQFTFPDTNALVGASAPAGATLAGPGKLAILPRSETELPCELAQADQSCAAGSPAALLACADEFFETNDTCSTDASQRLAAFPGFTALPRWNDYEAMCQIAAGQPCDGLQPAARFTIDDAGNLLVPINWGGVLVRLEDGTPVPRLINLTTGLPAFDDPTNTDPIRIPGTSFASALSPEGHFLPPILSPFADEAGGDPVLFGSVDAEFSVTRLARRGDAFEWCVGGEFDGDACNDDSECPGGACEASVCHAAPSSGARTQPLAQVIGGTDIACTSDADCPSGSECGPALFDFATRFSGEGCGPATDDGYLATSGSLVPLESLFTQQSDEILALPRVEAIEAAEGSAENADFNEDGDTDDVAITLVNRETGAEQQIGIGSAGAPGVAATQIFEGPYRFTAMSVEGDILAFLQSEPDDFQTDWSGNSRIQDSLLRVYRRAEDDDAPNVPLNFATTADPGPVIDGLALTVSDGLVFFRRSEADENERESRPSSTDETDLTPISFDSGFGSVFTFLSGERGAMSSDGRFVAFDTTANELDFELEGSENDRHDLYLRDRDSDEDGIFDEPGEIDIDIISVKTDGSFGDERSAPSFLKGADVTDDGRYVAFPSLANLDDDFDDDFVGDMFLRDRVNETTKQISTGECKGDGGVDAEHPVFANDGSVLAFALSPQEGGNFDICLYPMPNGPAFRVLRDAYHPSLSHDGNLLAFISFLDLDRKDNDGLPDVYVLDRTSGEVEWVSPGDGGFGIVDGTTIDDSGRYVAFTTDVNSDPADESRGGFNEQDPYVYDRETRTLRYVDLTKVLGTDAVTLPDLFVPNDLNVEPERVRLSPDGRYLATVSSRENDAETSDFFPAVALVTDLASDVTRYGSADPATGVAPVEVFETQFPGISKRGLHVGFATEESIRFNDINIDRPDAYTSGVVTSPLPEYGFDNDFLLDDDLDDIVLFAFDARGASGSAQRLGPASQVSTAGGNAAFLCDESAYRTQPASFGGLVVDGNGDGDLLDTNVCYWANRASAATNLGQDAAELDSSLSRVAARVWNGVPTATTVAVYDLAAESWAAVEDGASAEQTSDRLCGVSGDEVAFTTLESEQGLDFNSDGDLVDRYAQVYDAAGGELRDVALGAAFCEVGPPSGICVGPLGSACDADADCPDAEYCDTDAGFCRGFGENCASGADCGAGETCLTGSIIGVATSEAEQCRSDLLCENAEAFGCFCDLNEDGDCCDGDERIGLAQCDRMAFCEALPTLAGCSDCDLNGDGDCCDDVVQAYDTATDRTVNCGQAMVPCTEAACDPRDSMRVEENQIRFITFECDQATGETIDSELCTMADDSLAPGGDLNRNGTTGELIVQICNARTGEISVVGALEEGDETNGDPLAGGGGGTAFLGRGVCVQRFESTTCSDPEVAGSSGDCPEDQFCDRIDPSDLVCARNFGSCNSDEDCEVGSFCRLDPILSASGDKDEDLVSDAFDNCETTPNPAQGDLDRDGIGDVCDLTTCGNGIVENDEQCDDGNLDDGDACSSTCTSQAMLCDVNGDEFIDRRDIHQITLAVGTVVAPGDPRDYDGNGMVDLFDPRNCTGLCDREDCKMPRMCGLVGFELLAVVLPFVRRRLRNVRNS